MKLIRLNCFETNSSSTHCLIITDENTFEKWTDNKLFYKPCGHDFVTKEKFLEIVKEDFPDIEMENLDELIFEGDTTTKEDRYYEASDVFYSVEVFPYGFWCDERCERLEEDGDDYTTANGEKIIVRCWYGYDD